MKYTWNLFIPVLLASALSAKVLQTNLTPAEQQLVESSQLLNDIFSLMYGPQGHYYKKLTPEEIKQGIEEACQALAHLDPHSSFLGSEECKALTAKMSGEFCGIGVVVPGDKTDDDTIAIIELVVGGPAEKAGVKAGDKIIEIDGDLIKDFKIDEIMNKLKGEKNTTVTIKLMRANHTEPIEITITRDTIKDEISLAYYLQDHDIYYLLLSIFSEKSTEHVKNILDAAYKKKSKGIIIDLRNNTGGLFDAAMDIAGLFLPKGSVVATTKDRANKVIESWKTKTKPLPRQEGVAIFFIVNNYTASAAEILAGSLQLYAQKGKPKDNLQVFIVGTETFGKGSVQEVIPLRGGKCALKMTSYLYYLPFDTCVQGKGITPDFLIEPYMPPSETIKWMHAQFGRESVLKKHIKPHGAAEDTTKKKKDNKDKKDKDESWKKKRQELLANDYMLQNTVNLIDLLQIGLQANPKLTSHKEKLDFLKKNYATGHPLTLTEIKN